MRQKLRVLEFSRAFARAIAIGCAPACVVCRKRGIWNLANAIRSCAGLSCTHISSVASILRRQTDLSQRAIIRRALDTFGAEVIVPALRARPHHRLALFRPSPHRTAFRLTPISKVSWCLGEQVSTVLENALLYEEITVQKTLAETLLKSIPPGIVATDEDGIVRWFNPTAEQILGVAAADVVNRPVEAVGSRSARSCAKRSKAKTQPPRTAMDRSRHAPFALWSKRAVWPISTRLVRRSRRHPGYDGGGNTPAKAGVAGSRGFLDRSRGQHVARNSQSARRDQDFRATPAGALR